MTGAATEHDPDQAATAAGCPAATPAATPAISLPAGLAGAPGPGTPAVLAAVRPSDTSSPDLLEVVTGFERLVAWAQAGALAAVAELDRRFDAPRAADPPGTPAGEPTGHVDRQVPHPFEPTGVERLAAELGCALGVSGQSARIRIDLAKTLHARLPWVADALAAGLIDQPRARVLADETAHLDDDHAAGVVLAMLTALAKATPGNAHGSGGLSGMTSSQLRYRTRAAVLTSDPGAAARRAKKARAERDVYLTPERDGMAALSAVLPETDAVASYAVIDQAARALIAADRQAGLPARPIGQARADALIDLLTGRTVPAAAQSGQPATLVTITVPLAALLAGLTGPDDIPRPRPATDPTDHRDAPNTGHPADPGPGDPGVGDPGTVDPGPPLAWTLAGLDRPAAGELSRLGPVSGSTARDAALSALDRLGALAGGKVGVRWIAVDDRGHADAVTGTSYTIPPLLRAVLEARDRFCRFPGCTRPASDCDCDHNRPYPSGPTSERNTCVLCRSHHRLKTHSGWRIQPSADGIMTWISPLGRTYRSHPGLWTEPLDPPGWSDPGPPPDAPPDPALTWTDTQYQAWVDELCRQAELTDDLDRYPEATGPDLPPAPWARHLTDWTAPGEPVRGDREA